MLPALQCLCAHVVWNIYNVPTCTCSVGCVCVVCAICNVHVHVGIHVCDVWCVYAMCVQFLTLKHVYMQTYARE